MGKKTYIYYNRTNTCDACKVEKLIPGKACKERNKDENETGRWLCMRCYQKYYKYGTTDIDKINELNYKYRESKLKNRKYNETNTCDRCKTEILKPRNALRYHDEKGDWTGKWICANCNLKLTRDCRTGNQDPNSSQKKGDNFQELTVRWRSIVSTILVEDLNYKLDNHKTPIDHSRDSELGTIQTKGKFYYNGFWSIKFTNEQYATMRGFEFDHEIYYCASKDGNIIERIYIFPAWEILKRTGVKIAKKLCSEWCERYRIKDKETLIKVNEIWQQILEATGNHGFKCSSHRRLGIYRQPFCETSI